MEIDLLRHGLPEGGERFRGHGCDDPLDPVGWAQMQAAVESYPPNQWSRVLSSPLRRCRDFASSLAARRELPLDVLPDLREIGFGSWEGLSREYLQQHRAREYQDFYADPLHRRPPGAEPLDAFRDRVTTCLAPWLDDPSGDERLLVVAHAGVIRAILGWALDLPSGALYRLACGYGSFSRIRASGAKGWTVECVNHRRDNSAGLRDGVSTRG